MNSFSGKISTTLFLGGPFETF